MSNIAFALRESFAGTVVQYETEADVKAENGTEVPKFSGGVINIGDGGEEHTLDLRKALDEGDGTIVVAADADPRLVTALDEHPAFKRVGAGDEDPDLDQYETLDYNALKAELKVRELDTAGKAEELRDRLRADDEAKAQPDTDTTDQG